MGAWGVGTFENDDASDWAYQLEEAGDLDLVQVTLAAAADPEAYLEAPTCRRRTFRKRYAPGWGSIGCGCYSNCGR